MLRRLRVFASDANARTVSSHMAGLTRPEIYTVVSRYIGVKDGHLGDFSYGTHTDFYPLFCDLDIDPNQYAGTTRERFIEILSKSTPTVQAAILRGVLKKYEPGSSQLRTAARAQEIEGPDGNGPRQ